MESYVLVQNSLYQSSEILTHNVKLLCEKLGISFVKTERLPLEEKFLPFLAPLEFHKNLLRVFQNALNDKQKLFVCDSQTLLSFAHFFKLFYENSEFRESLMKESTREIDILELENTFAFAPEIMLSSLKRAEIKPRRWSGFRCAFLIDRELENGLKESQIIERIEDLTGLKILPFFKESYAYLLETNPHLAYKMGATDYYAMVDCGVDFILTQNISQFELLDGHCKKLQSTAGRDLAEIPILFIPQVILALFPQISAQELRFAQHKIPPLML